MKPWWRQQRIKINIILAVGLFGAGAGLYVLRVYAQETPAINTNAAAILFDASPNKETLDFNGRFNQIEFAVSILSNRLGRMIQQPTQNNCIEKRLTDLERQIALLMRQVDTLQRRVQRVEMKK